MATIADVAAHAGVGAGTVSARPERQPEGERRRPAPGCSPPSRRSTTGPTRWPGACRWAGARPSASSSRSSPTPRPSSACAASSPRCDGSRYDLVLFNVESPVHRDEHFAALTGRDRADGLLVMSLPPPPASSPGCADAGVPDRARRRRRRRRARASSPTTSRAAASPPRHLLDLGHQRHRVHRRRPRQPLRLHRRAPQREARLRARCCAAPASRAEPSYVAHGPHERDVARRSPSSSSPCATAPTAVFAVVRRAGHRRARGGRAPRASACPRTSRSSASTTSSCRPTPASPPCASRCSRAAASAPGCCSTPLEGREHVRRGRAPRLPLELVERSTTGPAAAKEDGARWLTSFSTTSGRSTPTAPRRCARSTSTSPTASSWCSSARRAAARPPRCGWSPAWR